jgi:hypothetical protein
MYKNNNNLLLLAFLDCMKIMKDKIITILIVAVFFSCEAIFVEDISDTEVVLLAPSNKTILNLDTIRFDWEKIDKATSYTFQLASPSFENANQIIVDTITTSFQLTLPLNEGDYEWRVKASNSEFETLYTTNSLIVE